MFFRVWTITLVAFLCARVAYEYTFYGFRIHFGFVVGLDVNMECATKDFKE